ncbi:MAG: hypothetical protein FGM40_06160 [Rhodocyclaceae bacterium]|nr:hypothetical protein [Rhodocyclaceae bacterium]
MFAFALFASMLPAVGNVLLYVLSPALLAALLLVSHQLAGVAPALAPVKEALGGSLAALLQLGLAYTGMQLGLLLLLGTAVPGLLDGMSNGGGQLPATAGTAREALPMLILVFLLSVPATMLMWFAPALVVFRRMRAWSAMRYSLAACLFNWRACLANGLAAFALLLLASLPAMMGLLIWVPLMVATLYTAYAAIFGATDVNPPVAKAGGEGPV